jgi:hypothetical protein
MRLLLSGFAMTTNESYLTQMRDKVFSGQDRDLFLHIGYCMSAFSMVELNITFLLARTIDYKHLDNFELLVKGMDARVKCERLRKALKGRKKALGNNFKERLAHFENKVIGLRNKITHSMLSSPRHDGVLAFVTLAKLPWALPGSKQIGTPPEVMSTLELFENALWLNFFADDLNAAGRVFDRETLEIDHPRSPTLLASH